MDLHVVVRGRVQGVGFRWFVRVAARSRGISGWVKNCADGSVEIAATGDAAAIQSLRVALASGPSGATVVSVDDMEAAAEPLPHPFSVLK